MGAAAFEFDIGIVGDPIVPIARGDCHQVWIDFLEGFEEFWLSKVNRRPHQNHPADFLSDLLDR